MKITPAENFGTYGAYVDDIDMDKMTDDEWMELGQLFLDKLVIVLRKPNMSKTKFLDWMYKWGPQKSNIRGHFKKKYGDNFDALKPETWQHLNISDRDRIWLETRGYQLEDAGDGTGR